MRRYPGALYYEPADLGFNGTTIDIGATVDGNRIPLAAAVGANPIGAMLHVQMSAAVLFTCFFTVVDINGTTLLSPNNTGILFSTAGGPVLAGWIRMGFSFTNLVVFGAGATNVPGTLLSWPYGRLSIQNNSALVPSDFTLRLSITTQEDNTAI